MNNNYLEGLKTAIIELSNRRSLYLNRNKKMILPAVLGDLKTRQEVMEEIISSPSTYHAFKRLKPGFQEEFIEFCMGVRGMKMTYDTFFKHIFDAEVHPERLSAFLSKVIGRPLKIKRALGNEHRRISEKASLVILDLIVEFTTGELADVEIQKFGYMFPGERASCYAADMMMRQYEREKSIRGDKFNYKDLKKIYTIVLMENSSAEFKKFPDSYIHRGEWRFDTGLKMNLLQEFYFIPLDIFLKTEDNKNKNTIRNELEAWLYFIGSDKPAHIYKVLQRYPEFEEMYRDIEYFRYHPEEAINMFSEALQIMDENTAAYMIAEKERLIKEMDTELKELDAMLKEKDVALKEIDSELKEMDSELKEMDSTLKEKDSELKEMDSALKEKDSELKEKDSVLKEMDSELKEKDSVLKEMDSELKEMDSTLKEKDSKLKEMDSTLIRKDDALKEKDLLIEKILTEKQETEDQLAELKKQVDLLIAQKNN